MGNAVKRSPTLANLASGGGSAGSPTAQTGSPKLVTDEANSKRLADFGGGGDAALQAHDKPHNPWVAGPRQEFHDNGNFPVGKICASCKLSGAIVNCTNGTWYHRNCHSKEAGKINRTTDY